MISAGHGNATIARRRGFSTAHLYRQDAFSDEKNRAVFGACYTPHGHGHNYVLEVFVDGPIDLVSGLVVNVNDLDLLMKSVCDPFDHHHVSFDVAAFKGIVPTTEHLSSYFYSQLRDELGRALPHLRLNRIRLFETDELWAIARAAGTTPSVERPGSFDFTRQFVIRGIHHLENATWSPQQNRDYYGICYGTHGHDYNIQVTCRGAIDETTGLAFDRDALERIFEREIRAKYDGVDLNKRFKNTSCEQLAIEFYDLLKPALPTDTLVKVGIQETRKNYFEFPPDAGAGVVVGA